MQKNYQSYFNQGVHAFKSKKFPNALQLFTSAIQADPNKYHAYINRGTVYMHLMFTTFAIQDFTKAIEIDPSSQMGYFNRFSIYLKQNKKIKMLEDLYSALSCAYVKKGIKFKQLKSFNRAITYAQNNYYAYIQRGTYYRNENNKILAQNDYSTAIQIDKKCAIGYIARANLHKQNKNEKQALQDLKLALKLKKQNRVNPIVRGILKKQMDQNTLNQQIKSKLKQFYEIRNLIYQKSQKNQDNIALNQINTIKIQQKSEMLLKQQQFNNIKQYEYIQKKKKKIKIQILTATIAKIFYSNQVQTFCKIIYDKKIKQTKLTKQNTLPEWNQSFQFQIAQSQNLIKFQVYKKTLDFKENLLGQGQISLLDKIQKIELMLNNTKSGVLTIRLKFID